MILIMSIFIKKVDSSKYPNLYIVKTLTCTSPKVATAFKSNMRMI